MATLAIIGLAAGAVMLTLPDTTPDVADEAVRLGARLTAAREEAVMTNRSVAIEATATGYSARVFDGTGWTPLNDGPFRPEAWQAGTTLKGDAVRVAFDPTGVAEPATLILIRETTMATISIDGAGEVRIR
jgi:general secretion pathway protein H